MEHKSITIGRDKSCDVIIPDTKANAKVSGKHATIKSVVQDNGLTNGYLLEDHSTNGTYVNSKLVLNGTYYVQKGDVITLGKDYVLDWSVILPFFEGTPTNPRPQGGRITQPQHKPTNVDGNSPIYVSPDPVYPDLLPNPDNKPEPADNQPTEGFVFNGTHWFITIGAFVLGLVFGLLIMS